MELSESDKEKIFNFGALGCNPRQMLYLTGWSKEELSKHIKDKNSEFNHIYLKGKDTHDYIVGIRLLKMAQEGDLKAIDMLERRRG